MNRRSLRTLLALLLQCAALAALVAAQLGASWLDPRGRPRLLLLVDRSQSMPAAQTEAAVSDVVRAANAAGIGEVRRIDFAAQPAVAAAPGLAPGLSPVLSPGLDASATDIEAALDAALLAHAQTPLAGVVVISDGHETRGDAARALAALRQAGLPLQWLPLGSAPPPAYIAALRAPARAQAGQRLQLTVEVSVQTAMPLRLKASARSAAGTVRSVSREIAAAGEVTLELDAGPPGEVVLDVALEDVASGRVLDARRDAALVEVQPRARLLYAVGPNAGDGALARSLQAGGWALDSVPAARLDAHADALDAYGAVVLDDIAIADAGPRFWQTLVAAVRDRGLGLLVLGGERAFALGGYRGSTLESVLPLLSEPAALDRPSAVVFAVDKSGSMGQGSGGVDRFQLAQRAVVETARGFGARDQIGLVVFDVAPRLLLPLGPAADGAVALARDWPVQPGGGTRIAPALEAAMAQLEGAAVGRRLLVLVTDGFVDDAPLAALRSRLAAARIETLALAVGADADLQALRRLVPAGAGQVLPVEQAAELPLAMRTAVERQRARVERGAIAVTQLQALPFAPGTVADWPPVAAHPVTRAADGATVAVQSRRGDPLIAFHSSGRGRVMAVAPGFGAGSPQWLGWARWPALAGGMADWIGGDGRAAGLRVSEAGDGLDIDIELPNAMSPAETARLSLAVDTPAARGLPVVLTAVAPGRLRARLPAPDAGIYTFVLTGPQGTQRQGHLRRRYSESARWGVAPALARWQAAGWIGDGDPRRVLHAAPAATTPLPADRSLLALALLCFAVALLLDRASGGGAQAWWAAGQGLRQRARAWRQPAPPA